MAAPTVLPPPDDRDAPLACWTCRHRREVEYGPALMAGIRAQQCRKFVRSAERGSVAPLPCSYAYDTFCGGGGYSPTLITRIVLFFTRLK